MQFYGRLMHFVRPHTASAEWLPVIIVRVERICIGIDGHYLIYARLFRMILIKEAYNQSALILFHECKYCFSSRLVILVTLMEA